MGWLVAALLGAPDAAAGVFVVGDDTIGAYTQGPPPMAPACSAAKTAEILAPATAAASSVNLDCSFSFPSGAGPVTKTIVIEGSAANNVVLNCNFAALTPAYDFGVNRRIAVMIRSTQVSTYDWDRPSNVTVKNCEVRGRISVLGMTNDLAASRRYGNGYTALSQRNAPTGIVLDTLNFESHGGDDRGRVYFWPGVTYSVLRNSVFNGTRSTPEVYLDHESGHNVIKNNRFQSSPSAREVIAIDASAYNRIVGNYFSGLNLGGIYIYRNCGQDGVIRVQEPAFNQIVNNIFYYKNYGGGNPGIWIGSRTDSLPGYCDEDAGYPFGSSADNTDHAHDNIVAQNRIFKFTLTGTFLVSAYPWYNYVNEAPTTDTTARPSGCYVRTDKASIFLQDHEAVGVLDNWATGRRYLCLDNILKPSGTLSTTVQDFSCSVSGSNSGCATQVTCPGSSVKVAVAATCNLELASYPTDYMSVPWNIFSVARASDVVSDGGCGIRTDRGQNWRASSGQVDFSPSMGWGQSVAPYCYEYDKNGGDCAILGQLLCL